MPSRSRSPRPEGLAWGVRHWAEEIAREVLERRGWRFVAANAVVRGGEIDLIMREGGTLVFVEVRQRRGTRFGGPAESLTRAKRARLRRSALLWTLVHGGGTDRPMRIDALLVRGVASSYRVEHVEDVA